PLQSYQAPVRAEKLCDDWRTSIPSTPRWRAFADLRARTPSGAPPDVCSEQLMDEGLIADSRASCLHAQGPQDVGVEANSDQLAGRTPEGRPADSPRAN